MTKKLDILLSKVADFQIFGPDKVIVKGIESDSRKIRPGFIFVAIKGLNFDGHDFISQATQAGATAIVGERTYKKVGIKKATYIKVRDSRKALGLLASAWYGNPSEKMKTIGVTGTDGKTTTASLIYWILKYAGKKVGLVSTINAKIGDEEIDTGLHVTNPEPLTLQALLARMVKAKCEYAVLEVTSHGLDQERVAGVDFAVGVLTNITHEHLDYHKNFLNYLNAKAKLFKGVTAAILNHDDDWYEDIRCVTPSGSNILSYAINKNEVDVLAKNIKQTNSGCEFDVGFWEGTFRLKTSLLGEYNVSNILAAVTFAIDCRVPIKKIQGAIATFKAPPGRLEKIKGPRDFEVFIDFAHTPNSLEKVLTLLKGRSVGRLVAVFGCAGERDREKREIMGEISGNLADISVFTAEDPRGEDVNAIIEEMVRGAVKAGAREISRNQTEELKDLPCRQAGLKTKRRLFLRIPERGEAIAFALQKLGRKDNIIIICGKGHEKSMAYGKKEYPWSDGEAVKIALRGGIKKIKR